MNYNDRIDIAYRNDSGDVYNGIKRYEVSHPAHKKPLIVAAPDDKSAMVAAAKRWGERWTSLDFYPVCTVRRV